MMRGTYKFSRLFWQGMKDNPTQTYHKQNQIIPPFIPAQGSGNVARPFFFANKSPVGSCYRPATKYRPGFARALACP